MAKLASRTQEYDGKTGFRDRHVRTAFRYPHEDKALSFDHRVEKIFLRRRRMPVGRYQLRTLVNCATLYWQLNRETTSVRVVHKCSGDSFKIAPLGISTSIVCLYCEESAAVSTIKSSIESCL